MQSIESSAKAKDPTLYSQIAEEDLIAKEFKYHKLCFREFTRKEYILPIGKSYSKGDFQKVIDCTNENVLLQNQVISMGRVHELYGIGLNDTSHRQHLKIRIEKEFPEKLYFLTVKYHTSEVIGKMSTVTQIVNDQNLIIRNAANILRKEILSYANDLPILPWTPNIDDLCSQSGNVREILLTFFGSNEKRNKK